MQFTAEAAILLAAVIGAGAVVAVPFIEAYLGNKRDTRKRLKPPSE